VYRPGPEVVALTHTIQGGPNDGVMFLLDIPFVIRDTIAINHDALDLGSPWRRLQDDVSQTLVDGHPSCTKGDINLLTRLTMEHEGFALEPNSHTRIFQDVVNAQVVNAAEAIATTDLDAAVSTLYHAAGETAIAATRDLDVDGNPKNVLNKSKFKTCEFKFFP
jgi:hypothetical protein